MKLKKVHIDNNGRFGIPAKIRKLLDLDKGSIAVLECVDGELRIRSYKSNLERTRNLLANKYNLDDMDMQSTLKEMRKLDADKE